MGYLEDEAKTRDNCPRANKGGRVDSRCGMKEDVPRSQKLEQRNLGMFRS